MLGAALAWLLRRHVGGVSADIARLAALQEQIVGELVRMRGVVPDQPPADQLGPSRRTRQ